MNYGNNNEELEFNEKEIREIVDDLDENTKPHCGLKNLIRITSLEREIKHLSDNKNKNDDVQE